MHPIALVAAGLMLLMTVIRWRKLGTETKVLLPLVAVLVLLYGVGVIPKPDFEQMIKDAGESLGSWTYLLVGLLAFLETAAFVGFIAPGEFTIVFGGVIAGQGDIDILTLVLVVWFAAVAGDVTSFLLGRKLGRGFLERNGPRFRITEARLVQVEGFFDNHGGKTILIGRFVGVARALAPFIAGASRMSFRRFLPYDLLGAGIWSGVLCSLGYIFWQNIDHIASMVGQGALVLGVLIAAIVGLVALRAHLQKQGRVRIFDELIRFSSLIVIGAGGLVTLIVLSDAVTNNEVAQFDRSAFDLVDRVATDPLTDLAKAVTHLGEIQIIMPVVGIAAIFLFWRKHRYEAVALVIGAALTRLFTGVLKDHFDRPRPSNPLTETGGSSFPSGHASNAMVYIAVAVAFTSVLPRFAHRSTLIVIGLLIAAAVGLTRIYLRAHYLSDVLAGWGLAAGIYAGCATVLLIVARIRHNQRADG